MAKGQNDQVMYRVVKFEIRPTADQTALLMKISNALSRVWNNALEERRDKFETHIAPIYEKLKKAEACDKDALKQELKLAFKEYRVTLFDQINGLTNTRKIDSEIGSVPRNWAEETLDSLDGSFKSFMSLRKNGDLDARPPRARYDDRFYAIPGRFGFKVGEEEFFLSCGASGGGQKLVFPIPSYQRQKLSLATSIKKFTLYRDERNLSKPGRFWISVAYEAESPPTRSFVPEVAVYVALGATTMGAVSPRGSKTIRFWRPDKHWQPKIEAVSLLMERYKKGSRKWCRANNAKRKMQKICARQQLQNQREVVSKELMSLGTHFVVTDMVIRSKKGKLADGSKPERGGMLGPNWSAQNTGNIGNVVRLLEQKVRERGGTVRKHTVISPWPEDSTDKVEMARHVQQDFLSNVGCVTH